MDAQKSGNKGSANYLKLFDALNSMSDYEESRLFKKLKGEPLLDRLSTEKSYLYNAILKSMRNYWSEKSVYSRVKDMILSAHYLLNRGLYEQCERILIKAKTLAKEYEQSSSILEINKLERTVYLNLRKRNLESRLKKIIEEKNQALESLEKETKFSDYKNLMFYETIKNRRLEDPEKIKFLKEKFPLEIEELESENSKFIHSTYEFYQSRVYYFRLLGKFDRAFESQKKIIDWWEVNKKFKKEYFPKYIGDLMNFIGISYENDEISHVPIILDKIELESPKSFHEERLVFETLALTKLLFFLNENRFLEAKAFVEKIEPGFKKYYIKQTLRHPIIGNIAILFFILDDHQTCIKWIDQIIEHKKGGQKQAIQRYIRVLKTICFLELDMIDEFDNSCRSTNRYIENTHNNKSQVLEYHIISKLKKIAAAPIEQLKNEYSGFKEFILTKRKDPNNKNLFGLDEYFYWINSKIDNTTILNWIERNKSNGSQ